jgi:hypothetical protein
MLELLTLIVLFFILLFFWKLGVGVFFIFIGFVATAIVFYKIGESIGRNRY